jgi:Invasin, domain 3/Putative metal-binding motif
MRTSAWTAVAVLCLSTSFVGCSKSSDSGGGGTIASVGVVPSRNAVVANGTNTVTLAVTDTSGGPVTVSTSRGTFLGGGASFTVPGASGTATLATCDAATDASCAGQAVVTATHGNAAAQVSITFGALATVCRTDCAADAACPTRACVPTGGGTGTCSSSSPSICVGAAACTPAQTSESTCNDGLDNDCDGDVDCADSGCENQQCQAGSPTFLCKSGACVDTASGLAIEITPARTRLPANGLTTTTVAVKVTSGSDPAGGMSVAIATTLGTVGAATGTTNADGVATFTFTASPTPGVATLTASIAGLPTSARTAAITMPALGSLERGPMQFAVQGAKGSGFQEFGFVSVLAKDDTGAPYPDGLGVRFEHRRLGGSTLGGPLTADTATCVAASGCIGFVGATSSGPDDPDTVGIASGFLYSGTVAGTLATSATATVAGVTRTITLPTVAVVGAKANGANFSIVCSPRNVPALAETNCAISFVDAPFTCEALLKDRYGNVLGTATQVVFMSEAATVGKVTSTPAYDPKADPSPDLGIATQIFSTLGSALPFDVAPATGEPSVAHGLDGCGSRTHNPRDGFVTMIAIADGEEAFFDANGNGVYDLGEPFIDQGEPFVDQNDNGVWDLGEWFLDVSGDGAYTPGNGVWDGATKVWTQTAVVYSGTPATMLAGPNHLGTRIADAGTFSDACTATPAPRPFEASGAGSTHYAVAASDMNLNRLAAATAYGTAVKKGSVTATYDGLGAYPDELGAFYRYWPCDKSGACASQCRSTGANLPCVLVPSIGSYSCGVAATATVGGAGSPTGPQEADWTVTTPYTVFAAAKAASLSVAVVDLASVCSASCTADPACPNHKCVPAGGGTGTCSSSSPSTCVAAPTCTPSQTPESSCSDGLDNDCNGDVDCADTSCDNQRCSAASAMFLCRSGACTDVAPTMAIGLAPARTRIPANGTATTTIAVNVTMAGQAAGGTAVTVSTSLGAIDGGPTATATTNADGIATLTYTAPAVPGVATITARITNAPAISRTATITMPALGSLQVAAPQFSVQGVKSSGFQEFGSISVLVKDDAGQPYPDGLAVRFEHHRLGGSTLGAPLTPDTANCVAASGCVGYQGVTASNTGAQDGVGLASAWLYSGTVAGTLVTTASATVAGVTRTATLPTVTVVGAKANGTNFSIVCSPRNVPALAETDCAISLVDAPFHCEALLKDRYNNVLGTATQVTFVSEAASIGQVTSTPAYDPSKTTQPDLGVATQMFNTLGSGLPFDTTPDLASGERSVTLPVPDRCGVQVHNPRDGVVTIVAIADGEEAFFDTNGNGVHDTGEPFVDQGEPFVDQNDSGAWDPGEWFLDVNGDGAYTAGNGVWDGATKIWTQTVVVYTGTPAKELPATGGGLVGTRWVHDGPAFLGDACTVTLAAPDYVVTSAQVGPPATSAVPDAFWVVASDANLNLLASTTTYAVSVRSGDVKVDYRGLASYADDLGMFYRYWPCDQNGVCASQCTRATGSVCRMKPSILSYSCGVADRVAIEPADTPGGPGEVDFTVTTPFSVPGTGKSARALLPLSGTNN